MTNIPGLIAAGECDYSMHGGNRLGAYSLLSAVYGGMVAGPSAIAYMSELETSVHEMREDVVEGHKIEEINRFDVIS
jgi:succinate dehydrogenase / fumarate reductase flavoprotein subunit